MIRFDRIERIGRVDGLVRINAGRNIFDIIRSEKECDDQYDREAGEADE